MLHRRAESGTVLISQPTHAWISGQIANAWGNAELGLTRVDLDLAIAVEQHDIAWVDWETRPTLNPQTGLPFAFNEMPTAEHIEIWNTATRRSLAYGRRPALLISMHGTYLYRRFHDFEADSAGDAALARAFLASEEAIQQSLIRSLAANGDISHSQIEQDRQFLSLMDALSLAICMGFEESQCFETTGSNGQPLELQLSVLSGLDATYLVDPWPFHTPSVQLQCEGRQLPGRYDSEGRMRQALENAEFVSLAFELHPA